MAACTTLLEAMRPKQWVKNLLVFVGLFFGERLTHGGMATRAVVAFALFCAASSAVYLVNDLRDREHDAAHPEKRRRPLASGRMSPQTAGVAAGVLCAISLAGAFALHAGFGATVAVYLALTLCYTFGLKHVVVVDLLVLTAGFLLRAVAGAVVVEVAVSDWFLICTTFLALFIGINKRRHEITLLEDGADEHRPVLSEYSPHLLDQMTAVVTACTIISYALYTVDPATLAKFSGGEHLKYTIVCVLFGVFRYMYLVYNKDAGGKPEEVLLTDPPLLVNLAVFICIVSAVIYL